MDQLQTLLSNLVQGMDDAARSGLRIVLILVIAWLAIRPISSRVEVPELPMSSAACGWRNPPTPTPWIVPFTSRRSTA